MTSDKVRLMNARVTQSSYSTCTSHSARMHTHPHTHAHTHTCTHARTHAHTHTHSLRAAQTLTSARIITHGWSIRMHTMHKSTSSTYKETLVFARMNLLDETICFCGHTSHATRHASCKTCGLPVAGFQSFGKRNLLRRLKSALFSRGLTAGRSRFIVAWKLSRRIRHFLVHAKMTD